MELNQIQLHFLLYLILIFCPKRKVERVLILFFLAMVEIETPYFPAMDDKVSPERTLCKIERV